MFRPSFGLAVAVVLLTLSSPGCAASGSAFDLEGYYRVRPQWIRDPDLDSRTRPNVERFIQHRVRVTPHIQINENISAHFQLNAMEDQVWGANPCNVLSQSTADRDPKLIVQRGAMFTVQPRLTVVF